MVNTAKLAKQCFCPENYEVLHFIATVLEGHENSFDTTVYI